MDAPAHVWLVIVGVNFRWSKESSDPDISFFS